MKNPEENRLYWDLHYLFLAPSGQQLPDTERRRKVIERVNLYADGIPVEETNAKA